MRHPSALGRRVGTERPGSQHTQPAQNKAPVAVLGPFEGNPTQIGSFSSAAKFHYSLLWWPIDVSPIFRVFGIFCLFGPFRPKRRLSGSAATTALV